MPPRPLLNMASRPKACLQVACKMQPSGSGGTSCCPSVLAVDLANSTELRVQRRQCWDWAPPRPFSLTYKTKKRHRTLLAIHCGQLERSPQMLLTSHPANEDRIGRERHLISVIVLEKDLRDTRLTFAEFKPVFSYLQFKAHVGANQGQRETLDYIQGVTIAMRSQRTAAFPLFGAF